MRHSKIISSALLIIINAYLLFGIFFLEWDSRVIITSYWIESVVLIFFSIIKLKKAKDYTLYKSKRYPLNLSGDDNSAIGLSMFFMLIYIPFIVLIYLKGQDLHSLLMPVLIFLIQTLISHGVSYKINFIGKAEFKKIPKGKIGYNILIRLIPIHITLIFAFASDLSVALLVVLKTLIDLTIHNYSHKESNF